ncbi:MAG: hypothetical protein EA412_14810 [Chitinophagaceae bacterium]|nr:MAG: hypothetical protein EA412_14810 [Chitinophagaceae bacterium]
MGFDLNKEKLEIFVDIDDTICLTDGMNYEASKPITENIRKVNKLYDEGHYIVYWTARGMKSGLDWTELTTRQLKEWGAKHHELRLTKPSYDIFIDDKVLNTRDWEKGKWIK